MRGSQILIALLLTIALSGCVAGDNDNDDDSAQRQETDTGDNNTTAPPTVVDIDVQLTGAYPANIAYDPTAITVENGTMVNLTFTNTDQAPIFSHDWVLEGYEENASTEIVGNGASSTVSFMAPPPGTYTFYCSVQGHRDNGMEGTFTVTA